MHWYPDFVIWILWIFHVQSYSMTMRENFVESFDKTCRKYDFVRKYWKNLENPSGKFFHFVFQEKGLRNGGLGDRLGGLISAAMMSLRFNRTLLIESSNGFDKLFQPYFNPSAIAPRYHRTYEKDKWPDWGYNKSFADHDETEYDLYFCINRNDQTVKCGMENGDVSQPIIKLRGNRAYICKWATHQTIHAHKELRDLGITDETDLLEVAGTLLCFSVLSFVLLSFSVLFLS